MVGKHGSKQALHVVAGMAKGSHLNQQAGNREKKLEWYMAFERTKLAPSEGLPSASPHYPVLPNPVTNWGAGIQMTKHVGDILSKPSHLGCVITHASLCVSTEGAMLSCCLLF